MRSAIVAAVILSGCCFDPSKTPAPTSAAPAASMPVLDAKAEAAVALAQKNGWLTAVNYEAGYATGSATITPVFTKLDFKTRQAVAASVAAAGMARKGRATFTVNLIGADGREVGVYSTVLAKLTE